MDRTNYKYMFSTDEQMGAFVKLIDALGCENVSNLTWDFVGKIGDLHLENVHFLYRKEAPFSKFTIIWYRPQGYPRENSFTVGASVNTEFFFTASPYETAGRRQYSEVGCRRTKRRRLRG